MNDCLFVGDLSVEEISSINSFLDETKAIGFSKESVEFFKIISKAYKDQMENNHLAINTIDEIVLRGQILKLENSKDICFPSGGLVEDLQNEYILSLNNEKGITKEQKNLLVNENLNLLKGLVPKSVLILETSLADQPVSMIYLNTNNMPIGYALMEIKYLKNKDESLTKNPL